MPGSHPTATEPQPRSTAWQSALTTLQEVEPPFIPLCEPGKPMLTLVDEDELPQRQDRRAPCPA
ncbi:hypothetical protein AB0F17_45805 [Nonomuraea sp. NPDC026600]|uniref:hypothetical protein n=1 Tax=Nonomuraea sp. NPDC026600 TaxID=3155363 RepID=UPI0033D0CC52